MVRDKIQANQLINRLESHALGEVELTPTQIKAIEILLKKTLPDLSAVEHSGDEDNPLNIVGRIERAIVDANATNPNR